MKIICGGWALREDGTDADSPRRYRTEITDQEFASAKDLLEGRELDAIFAGPGYRGWGKMNWSSTTWRASENSTSASPRKSFFAVIIRDAGDGHWQAAVAVGQAEVNVQLMKDGKADWRSRPGRKIPIRLFLLVWTSGDDLVAEDHRQHFGRLRRARPDPRRSDPDIAGPHVGRGR